MSSLAALYFTFDGTRGRARLTRCAF